MRRGSFVASRKKLLGWKTSRIISMFAGGAADVIDYLQPFRKWNDFEAPRTQATSRCHLFFLSPFL